MLVILLILLIIIVVVYLIFFIPNLVQGRVILEPEVDLGRLLPSFPRRVRILVPKVSSGLAQDAKIYHALIPNSYIVEVDRSAVALNIEANTKADINLYLENIFPLCYFPAKERWIMVNQEYLFADELSSLDVFFCKTRYAKKLLTEKGLGHKVVYLGHTSLPPSTIRKKDPLLCLHLAGQSSLKNTRTLIEVWQEQDGFQDRQPGVRLVITCRGGCYAEIKNLVSNLLLKEDHWEDPRTQLFIYPNLPNNLYNEYLETASLFICPSSVEGYGHYINEGRSRRALVLSTNFAPMNELVSEEDGILVPMTSTCPSWQLTNTPSDKLLLKNESRGCLISKKDLTNALQEYFSLSQEEKERRAMKSYQRYLDETQQFKENLKAFLLAKSS